MAMNKKEFAECLAKALEEIRALPEVKSLYDLSSLKDTSDIQEKYADSVMISKKDKLSALILDACKARVTKATEKELSEYKTYKVSILTEEINGYMLSFGMPSSDEEKERMKAKIEDLTKDYERYKDIKPEGLRKDMLDKFFSMNHGVNDSEIVEEIPDKSLSSFFQLLKEYKTLEAELKSNETEKLAISTALSRRVHGFNIPGLDEKTAFSDEGLALVRDSANGYIKLASQEEKIEVKNFGDMAKNSYESLTSINYEVPYTTEALTYYKEVIDPILYERANSQLSEWSRINNKLFKSKDDEQRFNALKVEIESTKKDIGLSIRNSCKEHYSSNPIYAPIVSNVDGNFIYATGANSLSNFFDFGTWPNEDEIKALSTTRELNKKEVESYLMEFNFAKDKYAYLSDASLKEKRAKTEELKTKITSLVTNKDKLISSGIFE